MRPIRNHGTWHARYELLVWDSWLPWEQKASLTWSEYLPDGVLKIETTIYEQVEPVRDRTEIQAR